MRRSLTAMSLVLAATGFTLPAAAAMLHVNANGVLTGASGVDINGALYDVAFLDGTCAEAFGACDPAHFAFKNVNEAAAASSALLSQVFIDGPAGNFDTNYGLTNGCDASTNVCVSFVPYGFNPAGTVTSAYAVWNTGADAGDTLFSSALGKDVTLSGVPAYTWAKFTAAASVPEPASWALMIVGFGLSGGATRRRAHARPASAMAGLRR